MARRIGSGGLLNLGADHPIICHSGTVIGITCEAICQTGRLAKHGIRTRGAGGGPTQKGVLFLLIQGGYEAGHSDAFKVQFHDFSPKYSAIFNR